MVWSEVCDDVFPGHTHLLLEFVCRCAMYQRYMFHISRQLSKLGKARHWATNHFYDFARICLFWNRAND